MNDGMKILLGALVRVLLVLLFASFVGGGGIGQMMGGGMMGGGLFGMLFMLLFWVVIIALIIAFVMWVAGQSRRR